MNIPPDGPPAGRVAIVTGGSRGIGRAAIRLLAARGYAVVVNYLHDQRAAESIVEAILADKGAAVAVRADVDDEMTVGAAEPDPGPHGRRQRRVEEIDGARTGERSGLEQPPALATGQRGHDGDHDVGDRKSVV